MRGMENKLGYFATVVAPISGLFGWLVAHEVEIRALSFAFSAAAGAFALGYWLRRFVRDLIRWLRESDNDLRPPGT